MKVNHPENEPKEFPFVRQLADVHRVALSISLNLVDEHIDAINEKLTASQQMDLERESREKVYASAGLIAENLAGQLMNLASMFRGASEREVMEVYDSVERILAAARATIK